MQRYVKETTDDVSSECSVSSRYLCVQISSLENGKMACVNLHMNNDLAALEVMLVYCNAGV